MPKAFKNIQDFLDFAKESNIPEGYSGIPEEDIRTIVRSIFGNKLAPYKEVRLAVYLNAVAGEKAYLSLQMIVRSVAKTANSESYLRNVREGIDDTHGKIFVDRILMITEKDRDLIEAYYKKA